MAQKSRWITVTKMLDMDDLEWAQAEVERLGGEERARVLPVGKSQRRFVVQRTVRPGERTLVCQECRATFDRLSPADCPRCGNPYPQSHRRRVWDGE